MRLDLLAALSGILISMQARANGELSLRLDNGLQAAFISFSSGLLIIAIISIFSPTIKSGAKRLRAAVAAKEIAPWTLFAGALGGAFVAVQHRLCRLSALLFILWHLLPDRAQLPSLLIALV